MKRSIERWTNMVPEAVAQGSTTQAAYCFADAQHDIIELFRENKEAADQMRQDTDTIAALRAENRHLQVVNERLQNENEARLNLADAYMERALQAEATAAAVVEALKELCECADNIFVSAGSGDVLDRAVNTLATLPARAVAMDRVCAEISEIMDTRDAQMNANGYIGTPGGLEHMGDVWRLLDRWRDALASTEPVSQSEADKGMEKRTP